MTTRYNAAPPKMHGVAPLPTGYAPGQGEAQFTIPSCGLEDVDVAVFNLFDKELPLGYVRDKGGEIQRCPVVFAAGERWAMLKKGRPLRDRNGSLILPLLTIVRTETSSTNEDVVGRGINQQTGELVVKRRLDRSDRSYQALVNRLGLTNQKGLAKSISTASPDDLAVERRIGGDSAVISDGALLEPDLTNNVYETIVIPSPQFYSMKYAITVWTQYIQHANQLIEGIMSSMLPQGRCWRVETKAGYWFVASLEDGSLALETNFEEMSDQERFVKHTFNVTVPAYIFASKTPGAPIPVRRHVSSPSITFQLNDKPDDVPLPTEKSEYVLGSDDPTLPLDDAANVRKDQRSPGWRQQKIFPAGSQEWSGDPANASLPRGRIVRRTSRSQQGETVYVGGSLDALEIESSK